MEKNQRTALIVDLIKQISADAGSSKVKNTEAHIESLSELVDEAIKSEVIPLPANPNNGDVLVFNGIEWIADNEWQEVTVLITGEELRDLNGDSPIDFTNLFPVLDINTQYLDTEIIANFNKGTENFNFNNPLVISVGNSAAEVGVNFINNLVNFPINNIPTKIVGIIKGSPEPIGGKITTTGVGKSPTGDSNVTLVVKYRILEY